MASSLWPHRLQHDRLFCPLLSPGVCSSSCALNRWCHPTVSSSVAPFSSCLQSFPASMPFPVSRLFISGGQSIEASASASVLPMNIQGWFPLGLTGLISQEILRNLFQHHNLQASILWHSAFLMVQLTSVHDYWETTALTIWTFISRVILLLWNMLFRFVITFLLRSKGLLISWLQSLFIVIL